MTEKALEGAFASPAAIAVHDDGDVLGNFGGIELTVDAKLFGNKLVAAIWGAACCWRRSR